MALLAELPCAVMVSGYPSALYDERLRGWRSVSLQVMNQAGVATEKVWFNFAPDRVHWARYAGRDFTHRQTVKRKAQSWARRYRAMPPAERLAAGRGHGGGVKHLGRHPERLRARFARLPDPRRGRNRQYAMQDVGMAALSVFLMQSPSFLAHQRALAEQRGRSNARTLFGPSRIPCDNHIRQLLDGVPPAHFDAEYHGLVEDLRAHGGLDERSAPGVVATAGSHPAAPDGGLLHAPAEPNVVERPVERERGGLRVNQASHFAVRVLRRVAVEDVLAAHYERDRAPDRHFRLQVEQPVGAA